MVDRTIAWLPAGDLFFRQVRMDVYPIYVMINRFST